MFFMSHFNIFPEISDFCDQRIFSLLFFRTMMANMPIITILFSLSWIVGMVIFANYADCDPLSLGYISKIDEIVPFYVEDKFLHVPGMLGLVMATLFNSALTLAVSNLNSLATVTFEDFLIHIPALKDMKDTQQLRVIRIIGVIYGLVIIGMSFLVAMLSGVIESSMLMTSATSGPLLGVFILAMLIPCANWKGAAAGMIFSHVTTLWITFGHLSLGTVIDTLPLSTEKCSNETFSSLVTRPISIEDYVQNVTWTKSHETATLSLVNETKEKWSNPLNAIYSVSYMYYAFIGSLTTVLVGVIVSLLTADPENDKYEEHLLHPMARKMAGFFPGKRRLYSSSTRLGNKNDATNGTNETLSSVTCVADNIEKTISRTNQGFVDDKGKLHLDNSYMEKLNALKNASLDVTNEIGKHTRL